jgi:hypothetical protein
MAKAAYNPQTRIFESDFMESMTRTHPIWPALFWGPVSMVALVYAAREGAGALPMVGLFALGVLLWTLNEYCLHRWMMHWVPPIPAMRRYFYIVHQCHHDATEWDRLVAPVPMAIVVALPILAVLYLTLGPVLMWPLFSGFVLGYLAYDYIHLYTHFGKPKSRIMKIIRRRHLQHHALHNRWFGVSNPLWDFVFGTHVKAGERLKPCTKADVDWGRGHING